MNRSKIFILGGGPAGLACAMYLLRRKDINSDVIVLESNSYVGGLSSSFCEYGLYFDYGSHRLHPHSTPEVLEDIKNLMGPSLILRPRNGRIGLDGKFVKFPLNPINLATQLSFGFSSSIVFDMFTKQFNSKPDIETYSSVLLQGVGPTLCQKFYFPYARKIWGLDPNEIAAVQAHRRVSANSITKTLLKVFENLPGIRRKDRGVFYYPKKGYGQISDKMAEKVLSLGGKINLDSSVHSINIEDRTLIISKPEGKVIEDFDFLFSTIPIKPLTKMLGSTVPENVKESSNSLKTRSMALVYFILDIDRFTDYDAHYFPEEEIIFSRLSEPKIYSNSVSPPGKTGLCFEIPCDFKDKIWNMDKFRLANVIIRDLRKYNFELGGKLSHIIKKKVKNAYPIYSLEFDKSFRIVDEFISSQNGIVNLGRQGLFAHDNLHHTVEMALCGTKCLKSDLTWDYDKWKRYRLEFEKNVVVD